MTTYSISISKAAELDLIDAIEYYSRINEKTTQKFIAEFKLYTKLLSENPYLFRKIYSNYRKMYLPKFKFTIIFEINDEESNLILWSILHQSRDQKKWKDRTQ